MGYSSGYLLIDYKFTLLVRIQACFSSDSWVNYIIPTKFDINIKRKKKEITKTTNKSIQKNLHAVFMQYFSLYRKYTVNTKRRHTNARSRHAQQKSMGNLIQAQDAHTELYFNSLLLIRL